MISTRENLGSQFLGCMSPIMAAEFDNGKRGARTGSDRKLESHRKKLMRLLPSLFLHWFCCHCSHCWAVLWKPLASYEALMPKNEMNALPFSNRAGHDKAAISLLITARTIYTLITLLLYTLYSQHWLFAPRNRISLEFEFKCGSNLNPMLSSSRMHSAVLGLGVPSWYHL